MTLQEIREACDRLDWEDSDLMPISVIRTLGNLRKLLSVAEAAKGISHYELCAYPIRSEKCDVCKIDDALAALETP